MKETSAQQLKRAAQSLFLAPNGDVPDGAQRFLAALYKTTGGNAAIAQFDNNGRLDESATMVAVGKREVWDWLMHLLHLPERQQMQIASRAYYEHLENDNAR